LCSGADKEKTRETIQEDPDRRILILERQIKAERCGTGTIVKASIERDQSHAEYSYAETITDSFRSFFVSTLVHFDHPETWRIEPLRSSKRYQTV
jgi:hypothetical protein